jgi:hypothetical protein
MKIFVWTLAYLFSYGAFAAGQPELYELRWTARANPTDSVVQQDQVALQHVLKQLKAEGGRIVSETYTEGTGWMSVQKEKGQDLTKIILDNTKGCKSLDDACTALVASYNRKGGASVLDVDYEGSVSIPVRQIDGRIIMDLGNQFRIEKRGDVTTEFISKRVVKILQPISQNIYARAGSSKRKTVIEERTEPTSQNSTEPTSNDTAQ